MEYEVRTTRQFDDWLDDLSDEKASAIIVERLVRIQSGLFGDFEPVGDGISELRIHYGSGYRIYYTIRGKVVVIVLLGGTKGTQKKDIKKAKKIAADL